MLFCGSVTDYPGPCRPNRSALDLDADDRSTSHKPANLHSAGMR